MKFHTIVATVALLATGCGAQAGSRPQPEPFDVELRVRTDDGAPLAGATWSTDNQPLGQTGADGALRLTLRGREGQTMATALQCTGAFASPDVTPTLRLTHTRRLSDRRPQPLTLEATCTREARDIALVVHADNGVGLPLTIDGKAAGVTDADGNAHVLMRVNRSVRKLDVALDTSARADLSPKSPSRSFDLDGRDGVLVFTEKLAVNHITTKPKPQPKPKFVPYRVD